jgi:hypothetical protein
VLVAVFGPPFLPPQPPKAQKDEASTDFNRTGKLRLNFSQ